MSSSVTEILIVIVLIIANGVFSMSETAIISVRKVRLQQRSAKGDAGAKSALALAQSPGNLLATVQIGITLIGILAGAFSGATLSEELAVTIGSTFPSLAPYSETISLTLVVLMITLFSLVIGELIPKNLALNNPEGIASVVARPMSVLSRVMLPFVTVLDWVTRFSLRLLGIKPSEEPAVTEDEIKLLVKQGAQTGTFEQAESHLIDRLFRLDDLRVSSIMTPRTNMIWIDADDSQASLQQRIVENSLPFYPVIRGTPDNVIGVLWAKDLLVSYLTNHVVDIVAWAAKPLFIPGGTTALRLLEIFKELPHDLAFVVDEYGGLEGFITFQDVLNVMVGDALSSAGTMDMAVVKRDDGSYLIDGMLPISRLKEILNLANQLNERLYETVGGLMMTQLGRIPVASDKFTIDQWQFEVVDMDNNRVDKVLVQSIPDVKS